MRGRLDGGVLGVQGLSESATRVLKRLRPAPSPWPSLLEDLAPILAVPFVLYLSLLALGLASAVLPPAASAVAKLSLGVAIFWVGGLQLMRRHGIPASRVSLRLADPAARSLLRFAYTAAACAAIGGARAIYNHWLPATPNLGMREFVRATGDLAPLIPLLWFIHAYAEELFFRGFLYNYLRRSFAIWPAILLNAVIFSLVHVPFSPEFALFLMAFSVAATLAYERFGSFAYPVAAHALANLAGHLYVHQGLAYGRIWLTPARFCLLLAACTLGVLLDARLFRSAGAKP